MRRYPCGAAVVLLLFIAGLVRVGAQTAALCFNQLQVLGSHNSYHQAPPQDLLRSFGSLTTGPLAAWQYSHPPLTAQLEAGVRAFELDVYWDPQGGLYGQAAGLKIAGRNGWLTDPRYKQPGFKVLHIPDFDFRSSCVLLTECLSEIKAWSDANPGHLPVFIHVEVKGRGGLAGVGLQPLLQGLLDRATAEGPTSFVEPPEPTAQTFRDLQAELLSVFSSSSDGSSSHGQLLTPDDVRQALGAAPGANLQQLLLKQPGSEPCPWPALEAMRGKVLPVLILYGGSSEAAALQEAYPDLVGSLAWVEQGGRRELPQAVFRSTAVWRLSSGNPLTLELPANATDIVASMAQAVKNQTAQGFIVRARADADTVEARFAFTGRRDAIIAAGPQIVASDFLLPASLQRAEGSSTPLYNTAYNVTLPGGMVGRCLLDFGSSLGGPTAAAAAAGGTPVELAGAAAGEADPVYCAGPIETAPAGRVLFSGPENGAAAPVAPPASTEPAARDGSAGNGSIEGAAPPPPLPSPSQQSSGVGSTRPGLSVAMAAGLAALAALLLVA